MRAEHLQCSAHVFNSALALASHINVFLRFTDPGVTTGYASQVVVAAQGVVAPPVVSSACSLMGLVAGVPLVALKAGAGVYSGLAGGRWLRIPLAGFAFG